MARSAGVDPELGQFRFYGSAFMFPAVLLLSVGFIAAELVIQA